MIHELLLSPTETASGSHPCCVVSVTYHRPSHFHGGNTGSNPVGDAKIPKNLEESALSNQGPFGSNKLLESRRDRLWFGTVRHDQLCNLGLSVPLHWRNRLCVGVCCDFEGRVPEPLVVSIDLDKFVLF